MAEPAARDPARSVRRLWFTLSAADLAADVTFCTRTATRCAGEPVGSGSRAGRGVAGSRRGGQDLALLILLAALTLRRPGYAARILAGAAVVPVLCLASGVIFLGTNVPRALARIASYTGNVDNWTWSGAWLEIHHKLTGGYIPRQRLGWHRLPDAALRAQRGSRR
jgi:hypothetical protein